MAAKQLMGKNNAIALLCIGTCIVGLFGLRCVRVIMSLINLSIIAEIFSDELSVLKKGENCLESGNILEVNFDGTLGAIKAKVLASMKKRSYQVEIWLQETNISSFTCECPRGQFKCHHIAAVLLHCSKNISKTDAMCQWKAPSTPSTSKQTMKVEELYPKAAFRATKRDVEDDDKKHFYNELKALHRFSGFYWILSPEVPSLRDETKIFSNILNKSKDENGCIRKEILFEHFKCSYEEVLNIAESTTGQGDNALWYEMRLGRLTASNFGVVLQAYARNRYPPSLYSRLLGKANLEGVKSIQWGKTHEATAIKEFEKVQNKTVTPTGLWLHECGFLGASPDGFVGDDAVIEIKCPYSHRNSTPHEIRNDKNYCFDENMVLKQSHTYFHQIQGILHITNRSYGYLVVWTPTVYICHIVNKDDSWQENLTILDNFYKSQLIDKFIE